MSSPVRFFTDRHDEAAKMLVLLQKNKDEEILWTPGWHLYGETDTHEGWYLAHLLDTLRKNNFVMGLGEGDGFRCRITEKGSNVVRFINELRPYFHV